MLADEGVLDRAVLIDGCLARLQRGGRAMHLENVTVLHDLLAPGLDEVTERARDYVALLPAAHRMAAELGQRELRRLDDAGRLEFGTFLEISEIVLFRREHKLIRTQLDWLDAVAGRDPRRAGDVLRAIALTFGQESAGLQRRALTVARETHGHATTASGHATTASGHATIATGQAIPTGASSRTRGAGRGRRPRRQRACRRRSSCPRSSLPR
jgi:hypothetical protein